jgi:hypothetical protein
MSCDILAVLKRDPAWGGGLMLPLRDGIKDDKIKLGYDQNQVKKDR